MMKDKIYNWFLIKKYPWLQIRNVWSGNKLGYDYTWFDDIPDGWRKRFGMDLVKDIDKALGNFKKDYQITQIKEKYRKFKMV